MPHLVIAGTHSGVGKTTVSLGLMAALHRRGLKVQPFKVGPDYIDTAWHGLAAGRDSHNLDTWLCNADQVRRIFHQYSAGADVTVVEGVMGLYDGMRNQGELASTAQISKLISAPVVLVVSARGIGRSVGAMIKGYCTFDPSINIIGVIINHVGSATHEEMLRQVVTDELGIPVLGVLYRDESIALPARHLGLQPAAEHSHITSVLELLAKKMEQQIDIDQLLTLSNGVSAGNGNDISQPGNFNVNLAVAMDKAFNFYYQDALHYLEELGARLIYFSPLKDRALPADIDGLLLGGGFPEMFLPQLTSNWALKNDIIKNYQRGLPIYAECGGLMYLCKSIVGMDGAQYPGVGLVPGLARMKKHLSALGYVAAELQQDCLLGKKGAVLHGHEFHWSEITGLPKQYSVYRLRGGRGLANRRDGYTKHNLFASFVHLHFRGSAVASQNLLKACADYRLRRKGDGV